MSGDKVFVIPQKRIDEAKSTFHLFQKEEGLVPLKSFSDFVKALGLHAQQEQVEEWSDEIDNGNGFFTFDDFVPIFKKKLMRDNEEKELKEAFRVLDKDKQGVIDVKDLRWILRSLGDDLTDEEIEDMITETDKDGSGTVDYDEFYSLMMG